MFALHIEVCLLNIHYLLFMKRRFLLLIGFIFLTIISRAQEFGGFPPSTKWKQINSDTARIIFDPKVGTEAERIASVLHRIAATENTLGGKVRKINILLHGTTTLANGYVALAPFKSEFYLIPGGNIFEMGNLPWHEQLVVHEYRHVLQFSNFNNGLSKVASFVLGEEGQALANSLAIPNWFFEGDAVYAETVLTRQGRGRTPYFFKEFNSLWKEGRSYSWMKLRNGSYRDMVPNHYPLGYLLVNYGYQKYGPEFWKKVTRDASAFKGLFYPFQKAIRQHSNVDFKTFRSEALEYYSHEVSKKRDEGRKRETVTNYYFPQETGNDSLIYLKDSYKSLPAFYLRDSKGEHKISLRSITSEDWISYRNGTIAYTAYSPDPRWSLTDYSDIVLLDVASRSERRITHHQKYFTPAFSPDGNTIVAVNVTDSLHSELHFFDRTGKLLNTRKASAGTLFIHPQYLDNQTIIVGIRQLSSKISLHRLDLNTMKFNLVLPPTLATIGYFYPVDSFVYFVASLKGTDAIYRLDLTNHATTLLTRGGVGHYFPNVKNGKLTWSQFTSNGYKIRQRMLDSLPNADVPIGEWGLPQPPFEVANADSFQNVLETEKVNYLVQNYKKTTGLFHVHSWRPYYEDPELTLSFYSDNILNTFSNELFYRYNHNESSHIVGFNTIYGGWYPMVSAGVQQTFNRHVKTDVGTITVNQAEVRGGYNIPLNFSAGKTYKYLNFGSDIVFNRTNFTGASKNLYQSYNSTYLYHFITWSQTLPIARQQIYPRLGYALALNYRHRIDNVNGYQNLMAATVYLPALFLTHSFVLNANFQQTDTANNLFSNRFANSRGYDDYYNSRMWKLSGNYHMPLVYPDWGFANIVYFLRVRSNFFYDVTRYYSKDKTRTTDLRSAGSEVFFETKWWNALPVTFGIRYSYLLDADLVHSNSPHFFEFIVPVNIIPSR